MTVTLRVGSEDRGETTDDRKVENIDLVIECQLNGCWWAHFRRTEYDKTKPKDQREKTVTHTVTSAFATHAIQELFPFGILNLAQAKLVRRMSSRLEFRHSAYELGWANAEKFEQYVAGKAKSARLVDPSQADDLRKARKALGENWKGASQAKKDAWREATKSILFDVVSWPANVAGTMFDPQPILDAEERRWNSLTPEQQEAELAAAAS